MSAEIPDITFSFVAPVYNEQDGLETFYKRLSDVAVKLGEPYEIIFVDDGSRDDTPSLLRGFVERDTNVRVVELSRNFGHQAALTAGYDIACGRAVVSLDSDCQHTPELIPEMVSRWREGYEVVYTVRKHTGGMSIFRRLAVVVAYGLIRRLTGMDLRGRADFRLLDRKAVDALKTFREQARFLRGAVEWIGFRRTGIPYVPERRSAGKRSFGFGQSLRLCAAGVFNFSLTPLRLASVLGVLLVAGALVYACASLILWALGQPVGGWTNVVMLILGLFGLQFLVLGAIGEYLGRTFDQAKHRPLYVVRERMGFADEVSPPEAPLQHRREEGDYRVMT